MKKILFLASIILFYASSAYTQEPFKFNFKAIPFGDKLENVLKRVEGAQVTENSDVGIEVIGNYGGLGKHFEGGLYEKMWGGTCLNSKVVKKFNVTYGGWENIDQIELFFVKDFGLENSGNLFLVRKVFKSPGGSIENAFNGMKSTISHELGFSPTIHNVKYQDFSMRQELTYERALVGVWVLKDKKVFLLVANNFFSSGNPEILYLSNIGWQRYLNACNSAEKEKEKKGKKAAKDF